MLATLACSPETVRASLSAVLTAFDPESLPLLPPPDANKGYRRAVLSRDDDMEVITARWVAAGQSCLHGHGDSAAMYRVISGTLVEERYVPDGDGLRCEIVLLKTGDVTYLPPGSYHRLHALEPAVTVHGYSPAPNEATSEVPLEALAALHEARCKLETNLGLSDSLVFDAPRRSAVNEIEAVVEGWAARETQANKNGELSMPAETLAEMRSSGILTAPMPEHLGGWNASLSEVAQAVRLLARRAPSTALALVMPLGNAATTRIPTSAVPAAQRSALLQGQRWIALEVGRGKILAVANSEPGAGGDLANTKTVARLCGDGYYRLTGRKSFATFGRDADYFLCAARNSDTLPGRTVVDGFFVPRGAPGLIIDDRWNPVGMRPTASVGLTLEDAPAEAVLGYPGCLEGVNARHWSTVLFTAVFVGVGEGALREASQYAGENSIWARSTLAECALNLDAAAGYLEAVAAAETWPMTSALQERTRRAKTFAARAAVETATKAAMISGGRSYTPDHPVFRFLCDALAGPLLRPPMPQAMDSIVGQLFPPQQRPLAKAA